jgi:hypothetical protein
MSQVLLQEIGERIRETLSEADIEATAVDSSERQRLC